MRIAFLLIFFVIWDCRAVTNYHELRGREVPLGPVQNMSASLTWNDSKHRDLSLSYNQEKAASAE